jgi:L,D-peptidoglycan transpeptidase YkuD (ErfK/YbiS/YcfS/YnhG family)
MKHKKPVLRNGHGRSVAKIIVRRRFAYGKAHLARVQVGLTIIPAAIGRMGVSHRKREGDGATPAGTYRLQNLHFRQDRLRRIPSSLDSRPLNAQMGWCDDVASRLYNRPVEVDAPERHEKLWRDDAVYDILISTSHNQRPRVRGAGSAIFVHLARPGYEATQGCVAISLADMRRLMPRLSHKTRLVIQA